MKVSRITRKKSLRPTLRASHAFYLYCIGESDTLETLLTDGLPAAIESDGPIELVVSNHLAAIASAVPLADYGEEALQARLEDPAWTAVRALRHETVVAYFDSRANIVPLRFGTIYLRRERIKQVIGEKKDELIAIINRLRGREEWGVNIFRDRSRLAKAVTSISPRLRELNRRACGASPGQSYLLRKKIDAARADEAAAQAKRVIREIERELKAQSEGVVRLRVSKGEAADNAELAAKLAFLVPRVSFSDFVAVAERLAARHAALGFRLELTGPWPAYNFAAAER